MTDTNRELHDVPAIDTDQRQTDDVPEMSPADRRAYILGAMGAAFAIGMLFLTVGAIVIWIMTLVW